MGILSRFKTIMASNVNAVLDKAEDPEKAIEELMRGLQLDLGAVRAEAAALQAEEQRAKRALEECRAEIRKLAAYAEKSRELGNPADAGLFLDKRDALLPKETELEGRYREAVGQAASLKELEEKLASDISRLEARQAQLKERMAAAQAQRKLNAIEAPGQGGRSAIQAAEDKINSAYYEAQALAELRSDPKEKLERELAELDRTARARETEDGKPE
ncbi:PspA/IM30 family protein [Paenibacillus sp. YN15]|uniref:PspA/IM30 family protein n=1 Tax=Paenibacillus sp. YN15 TaxID=1742774 RepID=UPI000DCD42DD|nr:PspA/IM30 family protein [Paenibacillus sp. YN15]RAU97944.1 PspA/IM30 family protein [Paenibacillus sp. YN15]